MFVFKGGGWGKNHFCCIIFPLVEEFQASVWRWYFQVGRFPQDGPSGGYISTVVWACVLETESPVFQFQLCFLECWVWGRLLCSSETGLLHVHIGSDRWLVSSPECGDNIPANHNSKVIPSVGAAEVRGWGSPQKSCRCRPRGPLKSSCSALLLPRWLPHPSFPSQCLLAGLVIFQMSEESYFSRRLSVVFQTQSIVTLVATFNWLTFGVHIPCLTGRFTRRSIRSEWYCLVHGRWP